MSLFRSLLGVCLVAVLAIDAPAQRLATRRPVVAFDAIDSNGPGSDPEFYKRHFTEVDGVVTLTLRLDAPAPRSLDVHYKIQGDAIEGTHYEVLPGSQSPVQFQTGDVAKTIGVRLLFVGEYFDERSVRVRLLSRRSGAFPALLADEVRLYTRSVVDPPSVEFEDPVSTGGPGVRAITAQLAPSTRPTDELIHVYWRQTNAGDADAAIEGVDYRWFTGGESGSRTIDTDVGQTSATIPFEVLPAATDGRVLELALDHELSDRSDENLATFTGHYGLEFSVTAQKQVWPGDPADHVPGPANILGMGPVPVTQFFDRGAVHPDTGEALNGLFLTPDAAGSGYHRKSFENEVHCDGPLQLYPLQRYSRWSQYVELPSLASGVQPSRFVRLSLRDRLTNKNHAVVFDRESPDGGLLGGVASTSTGEWGVWSTKSWNATSEFGVENDNGRTRLWILYHEEDAGDLGHPTARIMYPTWFSTADGSFGEVGGPDENANEGLLFYDQYLEMQDAPLTGPPGFAWEKRGNWWAPRGRATIAPGGVNTHVFTIQNP